MHPRFDAVELVIDPDGSVCYTRDVAKLEAMNAELLEALQEIITQTDGRNHYVIGHDRAYAIARAAIAKAKGEEL
jgi:hypothetical protein